MALTRSKNDGGSATGAAPYNGEPHSGQNACARLLPLSAVFTIFFGWPP